MCGRALSVSRCIQIEGGEESGESDREAAAASPQADHYAPVDFDACSLDSESGFPSESVYDRAPERRSVSFLDPGSRSLCHSAQGSRVVSSGEGREQSVHHRTPWSKPINWDEGRAKLVHCSDPGSRGIPPYKLQDSDLVRQPRYDSPIGIRVTPQSGPHPLATAETGLPPASCRARQYPIDPIPEDWPPTDHSQDPREGEGYGQDYVWAPPSAGRCPGAPRPHTTPKPAEAQSPMSVDPYPVTVVSELQEGDCRMPRAWQGLGTPIPFAVSGL